MSLAVLALLAVGLIGLVGALTAGTVATVRRQRQSFASANEIIPGVPTSAPAAWAGSHDPEARLHRRLRDAMTGLRAGPMALEGSAVELRVELEHHALALDESLVAIAAAPAAHRAGPLERVTAGVEAVERAVADVAAGAADQAASRLEAALADAREHQVTLSDIRAELDRPSHLPDLRGAPSSTPPDPTAAPAPEPPEAQPGS